MIETQVDAYGLDDLAAKLGRRKSHVELAMRRAIGSFTALLRSYVIGEVRKETGLPQREMNRIRIRGKVERKGLKVSLWVGSSPIQIRYLNPKFTKKGVVAGGKRYANAFLPWWKQGRTVILERKGKARLPVEAPEVDINHVVIAAIEKHWSRLQSYFDRRIEAELESIEK